MTAIDWRALARAARRAELAYAEPIHYGTPGAPFGEIGDAIVTFYQNDTHQAYLTIDSAGQPWLSISGTRGPFSKDVFDDIDLTPFKLALGGSIAQGCYEGTQALYDWADQVAPAGLKINVTGHSLGAARTHLAPLCLPPGRVGDLYSFESPKFADLAFYERFDTQLAQLTCVLNARDCWAAWPWFGDVYSRPLVDHIWLNSTGSYNYLLYPVKFPDFTDSPSDHDISLVRQRIEAIAASCQ